MKNKKQLKFCVYIFTFLMLNIKPSFASESRKVTIQNSLHQKYIFDVEIVRTPQEREKGLMFRQSLDKDKGMLFEYKQPHPVAMWMKNCFIPLDIIFIDSDSKICNIAENTIPESRTIIRSKCNAKAVLEINAGLTKSYNIKIGDRFEL
jgi:uncharacterized membrane protein (UPF0127 family)